MKVIEEKVVDGHRVKVLPPGYAQGGVSAEECDRAVAGQTGASYGFFRQMALSVGRGWPCSSYAVLTST
jgi:hypothetical protein